MIFPRILDDLFFDICLAKTSKAYKRTCCAVLDEFYNFSFLYLSWLVVSGSPVLSCTLLNTIYMRSEGSTWLLNGLILELMFGEITLLPMVSMLFSLWNF